MLGIKAEDVRHLVFVNYLLILIEAPVAFYFSYRFPAFSYTVSISIVSAILLATFLIHLNLIFKTSEAMRDIFLILFNVIEIISLTLIMHYVPSIRSVMILMYIPAIIFSSSMSLSYGIISLITIVVCYLVLTLGEFFNLLPFFSSIANVKDFGSVWQISNWFSFIFLMILAFMSNYFFEVLKRREKKIGKLAHINKLLYQKSKATTDEIFQTMAEALVVIDDKLKIIQYNKAFSLLNNSQEAFINKDISKIKYDFLIDIEQYVDELKKSRTKNIYYKKTDQFKHNYSINISELELEKGKTGYIVLITKHTLPWGVVYDSANRNPIDLALIRLSNFADGRVVETKVSDKEGRFGFLAQAGNYKISASKEGYRFPSKISKEGYKGEMIEIKSDSEGLIKIEIPLDLNKTNE